MKISSQLKKIAYLLKTGDFSFSSINKATSNLEDLKRLAENSHKGIEFTQYDVADLGARRARGIKAIGSFKKLKTEIEMNKAYSIKSSKTVSYKGINYNIWFVSYTSSINPKYNFVFDFIFNNDDTFYAIFTEMAFITVPT